MKILEILDRIETIIKNKDSNVTEKKQDDETNSAKYNPIKEIIYLFITFITDMFKIPFKILSKFLINEMISSMKKDAKLYTVIMGLMGVLFIFFSILWLFISVGIAVYFYDKGNGIFISVLYSIGFQMISFIIVSLSIFILSKKIKSLKFSNFR